MKHPIYLYNRDSLGPKPLSGEFEIFDYSNPPVTSDTIEVGASGLVLIDEKLLQQNRAFLARPNSANWAVMVRGDKVAENLKITCPSMSQKEAIWHFEHLKSSLSDILISKQKTVPKIGIIDIGPYNVGDRPNFSAVDSAGNSLNAPEENLLNHGSMVANTMLDLIEHINVQAEVIAVQARKDGAKKLYIDDIANAILLLATKFEVDIINVSHGIFEDALQRQNFDISEIKRSLEIIIKAVRRLGVVCFFASGNDCNKGVAIPASLFCTVGVGSFGCISAYPSDSHAQIVSKQSLADGFGAQKTTVLNEFSSHGKGVNVYAPGIGIPMKIPSGQICDFDGTSFATPLFVGFTSTVLSRMNGDSLKRNSTRARKIIQFIRKFTEKIDIQALDQVARLPKLTNLSNNDIFLSKGDQK